jgi:hypothetical protein
LLQISVLCENCVAARQYADTGIQLLFANNRNRVRGAVLGLSQDGACTDLYENLSVNSVKGYLSNDTTFKPPLFSLVNTFNIGEYLFYLTTDAETRTRREASGRGQRFIKNALGNPDATNMATRRHPDAMDKATRCGTGERPHSGLDYKFACTFLFSDMHNKFLQWYSYMLIAVHL